MTYNGDDIPYMGMWAELRKNYLLEEKPEDYAELVEEKMLTNLSNSKWSVKALTKS